jgi:SAM-dependent methyltransferase
MLRGTSMKTEIAWQDAAGAKWVAEQEQTDAQLAPLGLAALEVAGPGAGETVLDVGCGAGQSTLQLAELVGPRGHVLGVDISPPLLDQARKRVAQAGLDNVELLLGDAAVVDLPGPFDFVFSRFGVMFFDDPVRAFSNLARASAPGARLCFVCWQGVEVNAWATAPLAAVRRLRPEQPLPELLTPGRPGPFSFADAHLVRDILTKAGFASVVIAPREQEMSFGGAKSVEQAVRYATNIGPAARFLASAELTADDPRVTAALTEALTPFATPRGVLVPARILIVTARRS